MKEAENEEEVVPKTAEEEEQEEMEKVDQQIKDIQVSVARIERVWRVLPISSLLTWPERANVLSLLRDCIITLAALVLNRILLNNKHLL